MDASSNSRFAPASSGHVGQRSDIWGAGSLSADRHADGTSVPGLHTSVICRSFMRTSIVEDRL